MRFAMIALLLCLPASAAEFVVHGEQPLMDSFVGFGAHANGWAYCWPNWGFVTTEKNIDDLESKFIDLAPQHVRIFVEIQPDSPQQRNPEVKQSVIRTIELCKRAGATVNCTLWHGPYKSLPGAAQAMVDVLDDFINVHHLDNVQYVTLQNEPNEYKFDMKRYNVLYKEFAPRLERAGLRDKIKIVGGDLTSVQQSLWFRDLAWNLDFCDGYSVHMYCEVWNRPKLVRRIPEIFDVTQSLPKDRQRPIYMTEFGFRGARSQGEEEPGHDASGKTVSDTIEYGLCYGWRVIDALDHGFVCMLSWDAFDAHYEKRDIMHYGLIKWEKGKWSLRPYANALKLFTHTAKPGWRSIKVDGDAGDVKVAAMRGGDDHWTVYAINRANEPATITVTGLPASQTWVASTWNAGNGDGDLSWQAPEASTAAGAIQTTLPPRCIKALTTLLSR